MPTSRASLSKPFQDLAFWRAVFRVFRAIVSAALVAVSWLYHPPKHHTRSKEPDSPRFGYPTCETHTQDLATVETRCDHHQNTRFSDVLLASRGMNIHTLYLPRSRSELGMRVMLIYGNMCAARPFCVDSTRFPEEFVRSKIWS